MLLRGLISASYIFRTINSAEELEMQGLVGEIMKEKELLLGRACRANSHQELSVSTPEWTAKLELSQISNYQNQTGSKLCGSKRIKERRKQRKTLSRLFDK